MAYHIFAGTHHKMGEILVFSKAGRSTISEEVGKGSECNTDERHQVSVDYNTEVDRTLRWTARPVLIVIGLKRPWDNIV